MISISVTQNGHHVEAKGAGHVLRYELTGIDLPPLRDYAFAVWHFMPLAMTTGQDLFVDGPVDEEVLSNARRIIRIWEMWYPEKFARISIQARETVRSTPRPEVLTFFSGGVDSTYMLLDRGPQPETQIALTVQGMDYNSTVRINSTPCSI